MGKIIRFLVYIALFLLLVTAFGKVLAEDAWIMCQPDSFVNVRESPGKGGRVVGYLELGDAVQTGRNRNGYTHVTGISNESGEGWVASGYIVTDAPQVETVAAKVDANGRVACRRAIGGNRRKWLHAGDDLTLYASSAEWSITSEGFVKTQYILAER